MDEMTAPRSRNLYKYINDLVGSDEIVDIRRSFFNALDEYYNNPSSLFTQISIGSMAEGLHFASSDFDVMLAIQDIEVFETESDFFRKSENSLGLVIDTVNASPGFALLKSPLNRNYFVAMLLFESLSS